MRTQRLHIFFPMKALVGWNKLVSCVVLLVAGFAVTITMLP
jgi:hypothetical protein